MGRCVVKQKPGQGFPFYPYRTRRRSAVKTTARSDPKIFTAGCHIDNFRNGRQSFFRTSDNHTDVFQIFLKFDTG